jgi:hypothetical protein
MLASSTPEAARSLLIGMTTGPAGILMYKWLSKTPLILDMGDKKPYSMMSCLANDPLYLASDPNTKEEAKLYDPRVEKVPDDIFCTAETCRDKDGKVREPAKGYTVERVSRQPVCAQKMQEMHNATEELGNILAAYPALGMDPAMVDKIKEGQDIFDHMGYKKIAGDEIDPRVKKWKEGGQRGPCMNAFLNDPEDPSSGPANEGAAAQAKADDLVKSRRDGMLGSFLKEMGKVCTNPSEVVGQMLSNPQLMERFYSCEDSRFAGLLQYHYSDELDKDDIKATGKTAKQYVDAVNAKFGASKARSDQIAALMQNKIPEQQCKERKDVAPMLCYAWKDEKVSERRGEILAGAMEVGMLAMEAWGAKGMIGSLAGAGTGVARNLAATSLRQRVTAGVSNYGMEAVTGTLFGLGMNRLSNWAGGGPGAGASGAETTIAMANAGFKTDLKELQNAVVTLEQAAFDKNDGGIAGMLIDNAVQGILFSHSANEQMQGTKANSRGGVNAMKLGKEIRDFGDSQKGTGFNPAVDSLAEARARAQASGDKDLDKTLADYEQRVDKSLGGASKETKDHFKSKPINDAAAELEVLGAAAMKTDKTVGDAINEAGKLKDEVAQVKKVRQAIEDEHGKKYANSLSDAEVQRIAKTPTGQELQKRAAAARAKRAPTNDRTVADAGPAKGAAGDPTPGAPAKQDVSDVSPVAMKLARGGDKPTLEGLRKPLPKPAELAKRIYKSSVDWIDKVQAKRKDKKAFSRTKKDIQLVAEFETARVQAWDWANAATERPLTPADIRKKARDEAALNKLRVRMRNRIAEITRKDVGGMDVEAEKRMNAALAKLGDNELTPLLNDSSKVSKLSEAERAGLNEVDELPEVSEGVSVLVKFLASKEARDARAKALGKDETAFSPIAMERAKEMDEGRNAEIDARINALPENERAAARAATPRSNLEAEMETDSWLDSQTTYAPFFAGRPDLKEAFENLSPADRRAVLEFEAKVRRAERKNPEHFNVKEFREKVVKIVQECNGGGKKAASLELELPNGQMIVVRDEPKKWWN